MKSSNIKKLQEISVSLATEYNCLISKLLNEQELDYGMDVTPITDLIVDFTNIIMNIDTTKPPKAEDV